MKNFQSTTPIDVIGGVKRNKSLPTTPRQLIGEVAQKRPSNYANKKALTFSDG